MASKVAIVTGSNKGIGFGIVRNLCKNFSGDVFLTARDETKGLNAVEKLEKEGLKPKFHKLNVEDRKSVEILRDFLKEKYKGLDVIVNNAGIVYKLESPAPLLEQAEKSLSCNFWGILNVSEVLFPILKPFARVVHMSSMMSFVVLAKGGEGRRRKLLGVKSIEELKQEMKDFVSHVKAGTHKKEGWSPNSYGVSKLGVLLLTPLQQKLFNQDQRQGIVVNCCCPGYVSTEMTDFKGTKSVDEGADTPSFLALLPPDDGVSKGKFLTNRKEVEISENSALNFKKIFNV